MTCMLNYTWFCGFFLSKHTQASCLRAQCERISSDRRVRINYIQRQPNAKALYSYVSSLLYKISTENAHIASGVWSQCYGTAAISTILLTIIIYFLSHPFRTVPTNTFPQCTYFLIILTLWGRNYYYFFLISAHPVYKMWIIQEPNKLALWNKLHFEEKKTESIDNV